ncbi:MAG: hypothetical protein IID37_08340 [Planctomycetes bacterium]|nr:hypothetical protein [Planctomycetota bacterium]
MISRWYFESELSTWAILIELVVAGVLVILAGSRLARLADTLGKQLGLGSAFVGILLLATVTSLPEVVTSGTAVAIGDVDLAFAAIAGSCSFNITLIVLLNAMVGGGSILGSARQSHVLTSSFGLVLISFALLTIVGVERLANQPAVAQAVELLSMIAIAVTYIGCMRLTHRFEKSLDTPTETTETATRPSPQAHLYKTIAAVSAVLVVGAWWMAQTGNVLADHPIEWLGRPLGATFVGAAFLAVATSLPEIVTGIAAVRLGNLDLALGNLFGSNMFNIFVLPMMKGVSLIRGDALLFDPGTFNGSQALFTGLLPILLTAIAIGGLTYRSKRRMLGRFGFDSVLIAIVYGVGMIVLLTSGG